MIDPADNSLDARLCDVTVPPDLAERIKSSLAPTDDELDDWLRRVPVPETLTLALHEVPDDLALDELLCRVPAPRRLADRLRHATPAFRARRLAAQFGQLALAASWFLALSVTLLAGLGAIITALLPQGSGKPFAHVDPSPSGGVTSLDEPLIGPALPFAELSSTGSANRADRFVTIESPDVRYSPPMGAAAEWQALLQSDFRPLDDVILLRFGVLGSPQYADDRLPEIEAPHSPRAAGVMPRLVRGYDRGFFLKHRVFPPISPAADPQLEWLAVPLVTESEVLSRLERLLAEDRRLPASELRCEEFLAAMNYGLAPAPAGAAAIRTAAGPSPFGPAGSELLFVGVQAGGLGERQQAATHLVLAIDLSQSMSRGGRLEMLQVALNRLIAQVGSRDRISLVVFHEEVVHQVELAGREDAATLRELIAGLAPRGGTNLAAGLQAAASLAIADALPPGSAKRLVLITDSQAQLPTDTQDQLRELLVAAGQSGVRLDVLDVGQRELPDPVLADWAQNLGGELRPARTARQLYWSLLESLAGTGPVVASEAKLELQFNPDVVRAYRLIGHEANALAEMAPVAVQAELAAGESAAALVELWLTGSDSDNVGQARLTWRDAAGRQQRQHQRISRLQFATTFAESAPALQQAAIAAEVGQELAGSRTALRELDLKPANNRGWDGLAAVARQVHSQVKDRPEFMRLVKLIEALDRQ